MHDDLAGHHFWWIWKKRCEVFPDVLCCRSNRCFCPGTVREHVNGEHLVFPSGCPEILHETRQFADNWEKTFLNSTLKLRGGPRSYLVPTYGHIHGSPPFRLAHFIVNPRFPY